jgi:uncharacterized membrane protein
MVGGLFSLHAASAMIAMATIKTLFAFIIILVLVIILDDFVPQVPGWD